VRFFYVQILKWKKFLLMRKDTDKPQDRSEPIYFDDHLVRFALQMSHGVDLNKLNGTLLPNRDRTQPKKFEDAVDILHCAGGGKDFVWKAGKGWTLETFADQIKSEKIYYDGAVGELE
jgi:hypothetical protein